MRAPLTDLTKLVIALKLRFFDQMDAAERRAQLDMLIDLTTSEIARLNDLRADYTKVGNPLGDWLAQDIQQAEQRLAWYRERLNGL